MQSSLNSDGSETSSNVWNKTTGSYEKNYYFNPIKISDISLGISAELQRALGSWDPHTTLNNTYINVIQYSNVYKNGEDKLDEGGQKIMIAQSLKNILGNIEYTNGSTKKLYFGIPASKIASSDNAKFIGFNHTGLSGSDVWISRLNSGLSYSGAKMYSRSDHNYGVYHNWSYNYLDSGLNIYRNIDCDLYDDTCNTQYACHHNTSMCVWLPIQSIVSKLSTSDFNMKLSCLNDARISYYSDITKKTILKNKGKLVNVNVKPLTNGNHLITFGSGINEKFESSNFDITYITAETFGNLQCIQRNSTSNYGTNY